MKKIILHPEQKTKDTHGLFGIFFEDINHAADGGLYAELVRNRSFEFDPIDNKNYNALTAWSFTEGLKCEVLTASPIHPNNPHNLHVVAEKDGILENKGYNAGICLKDGNEYRFGIYTKGSGCFRVAVTEQSEKGEIKAVEDREIKVSSDKWEKTETTLKAVETTYAGRLRLFFTAGTELYIDMVSLFPTETFMGRKNGLRKDLAEALKELHPGFMRFPGGCLVHDGNLNKDARDSMYRWINTIGPVEQRPSRRNNWGYDQTLGLGYYEYFILCEDIGCEPLPVVPGGFNPHRGEGVEIEHIGEYVEEALALIEFANGDENTKMGKVRAELGHPAPFGLKYIGVGNEEIGDGFFERYPYFHKAIREKYPEIRIINSAGPFAVGEGYDAGWRSAVKYGSDLVDEHYYSSPEWFLANMHHYEDFDPKGPKVFLGEYASWGNTFYNALTEAAYMTHLEKAPAVELACYAPLFCNVDYPNWKPDMIFFDGHRSVKTPNYYVQKLFMDHAGEKEIAFDTEDLDEVISLTDENSIRGAITIAGNDVQGVISDIIVKADGKTINVDDINVKPDNKEYNIADIWNAEEYSIEFSFKRTSGRKGLKICLGKKEKENTFILWEFGGWDNWDCNIASIVRGRASTISHRIFHVTDEPYKLRVEVSGRRIKTFVNGEMMNNTVDRLPELEELYVSASRDKDGNLYLKCVNMTGEDKRVMTELKGYSGSVAYGTMLKGGFTDENTFEEEKVKPQSFTITVGDEGFMHSFPAHSICAFKIGLPTKG